VAQKKVEYARNVTHVCSIFSAPPGIC